MVSFYSMHIDSLKTMHRGVEKNSKILERAFKNSNILEMLIIGGLWTKKRT